MVRRRICTDPQENYPAHPTANELLEQLHENVTHDYGTGVNEYGEPRIQSHHKAGLRPKGQRTDVITTLTATNGCARYIAKKRLRKLKKYTRLALDELRHTYQ